MTPSAWSAALTGLALGLPTAGLPSQDADRVLERAVAAYGRVQTLHATFAQTITNPMIGRPDSSRGQLFLVRPDRFGMRFTSPAGDRIVVDGRWLWLYLPSSVPEQVVRAAIPDAGPAGPNLFAQFLDEPAARYRATYVGEESIEGALHDLIRLEPKVDVGFKRADLAIGRDDGLIRMVDLIDHSGLTRRLELRAIEVNVAVPAAEVSFSPPAGTRVVTQP